MMKKTFWLRILVFLSLCSCSGGGGGDDVVPPVEPEVPEASRVRIALNCGIASRATETAFESGDKVGLFVVNYNGGAAGVLQNAGNHADNVKFTYSSEWTPEREIFWKDETTRADFYCYYPYATVTGVGMHKFAVKENQSTEAGYAASDFLWGKASNIAPTDAAVNITLNHVFSCMQIKVEPGKGYTADELAKAIQGVTVHGTRCEATIDLATGKATAGGDAAVITPRKEGDMSYKALVVPQAVDEVELIVLLIDGKEHALRKAFTFEANKRHTFTVTVNKTSNGINVGIGNWEDDGEDHGGVVE